MNEYYGILSRMILGDTASDVTIISPRERESLRFVMSMMNSLAGQLADYTGKSVPEMLRLHAEQVRKDWEREQ